MIKNIKMFKIKHLLPVVFLLCIGFVNAQSLSVVNTSTVLIIPSSTTIEIDTAVDITIDSLMSNQTDFEIMFIVEASDSALVNKVHIDLGYSANDSTLLNTSYGSSNNTSGDDDLIYETYSDFINVKVGEFTIDSTLHYNIRLEDNQGILSAPYLGTISH